MTIRVDARTQLELIREEHSQPVFELIDSNRKHLGQWLPWVDNMRSVKSIEEFIHECNHRNAAGREIPMVIVENGKVVGRVGVYKLDNLNRTGEIGYWIGSQSQGKGIMTKSCKALIAYCLEDL